MDGAHWAVGEHNGVCGDILKVCGDMECVGGHNGGCVEMCWGVWKFFGVGGVYLMQCGDKLGSDDVLGCVGTHWVASRHPHPCSSSCSGWRGAAHPLAGC